MSWSCRRRCQVRRLMACVLCLEGGGRFVCQCDATAHIPCLAALMDRGYDRCVVCSARLESQAVVLAARLAVSNASDALGPEHATVQWRKLQLASAYADAGKHAEAKRVIVGILETVSGRKGSLFLACQVDLARARIKLKELHEAKHALEDMKLSLERAPYFLADRAFGEVVFREVCKHLVDVYLRMGGAFQSNVRVGRSAEQGDGRREA